MCSNSIAHRQAGAHPWLQNDPWKPAQAGSVGAAILRLSSSLKGPCTQIVYFGPKVKAKVYSIWVHGPLGFVLCADQYLSLKQLPILFLQEPKALF